jgi:hypothetical protein
MTSPKGGFANPFPKNTNLQRAGKMKATKQQNEKLKKRKPLRIILTVIIALLVLLAITLGVLVPAYISSDSGRRTILAKINESVEGKTDFASLSMSWFKGINLTDFAYDDSSGLASVRIKQISTMPHYGAILTGSLSFGKTVVDEPKVAIDLRKRPAPATAENHPSEKTSAEFNLPVSRIDLHINNGDVKVTDTKSNTIHLEDIDSSLNFKGPDRMNTFAADMLLADSGTPTPLHTEGTINPTKISGELAVEVNQMNLDMLAPLFDLADVQLDAKGQLSANIKTSFKDSKLQTLTGTATGNNIDIGGPAVKGDRFKTSALSLDVQMAQQKDLINVDKLILNTDWAKVDAVGKVPTDLKSLSQFIEPKADYNLKATIDVDLPAVANQMPNTLKLEPGTTITSGKLSGNISRTTQADKAQIEADFRITNLAGLVDQKPVALSEPVEAQVLISSDKSTVNFEKLQATSSFAQVKCTGTEKLLAYEANVNLQKLQSELGSFVKLGGYKTAGLVTSAGKITSADDTINVAGSSKIENLHLTTPDGQTASEPQADIAMDLDINRKTSDIAIKNLDCTADFGKLEIKNALLPAEKKPNKPLVLPIDAQVDLAKIRPFLMLSSAYPKKLSMAGNATSKLRLSLDEQTTKITTDFTQIQDFSYGTPKTGQVTLGLVTAKLDATVGPEKTAVTFDLTNPQLKAKGNFNIDTVKDQKTMSAKADCDYEWKFVSTLLSAFMPSDLTIEGKNKTTVEFSSSYPADKPDQLLANLSTKPINIAFDKADYRGFTVSQPSQIAVQFNKGLLDIPKFSMKVNDGTLTFAAKADFTKSPTLLTIPEPLTILDKVKVDERVSIKLLQYLNPIFKDVDRFTGVATFSAQTLAIPLKDAGPKDLLLDGNFLVKDMRLASGFFDLIQKIRPGSTSGQMEILSTQITAINGLLRYNNMQLNAGNNPFNFVGRVNLVTHSIDGSSVITPYTTGRTVKVGEENTPGRITIPFKGTYDKPELDMGKLLQQNLGNILEEGLKDGKFDIGDILKNR